MNEELSIDEKVKKAIAKDQSLHEQDRKAQ